MNDSQIELVEEAREESKKGHRRYVNPRAMKRREQRMQRAAERSGK